MNAKNENSQIAGSNHFEMLTFFIAGQRFGVNVFKVREIIPFQRYTKIPHQAENVMGIVIVRNETMPMISLSMSLNLPAMKDGQGFFIITELNRHVQAIWVDGIEQIHRVNWSNVNSPPPATKTQNLTAVVNHNEDLISVLDLEALLTNLQDIEKDMRDDLRSDAFSKHKPILIVDDSRMARSLMMRTITSLGGTYHTCNNGLLAWTHLQERIEQIGETGYSIILTDIEMPQLDGYTLTQKIKAHEQMRTTPVLLHSSLSGQFNLSLSLSQSVGADYWLSKFNAKELKETLIQAMSTQ